MELDDILGEVNAAGQKRSVPSIALSDAGWRQNAVSRLTAQFTKWNGGSRRSFSVDLSRAKLQAVQLTASNGDSAEGSGSANEDMNNSAFKIPYGERDGALLHISEVERGLRCECVCPVCREPLVARKGEKVKHHFGHYPGANCSAETVLHQLGKRLLHRHISAAIADGSGLPVVWPCQYCPDQHEGNLVELAHTAAMELHLGACRPDVGILKADGTPVALVEIVVSHPPDENVLTFVSEHDVTLFEFHLNSADDLELLDRSPMLAATKVNLCTRPKCPTCDRPLCRKTLHVVDASCWKCNAPMNIAFLMVDGTPIEPERFSERDRAEATEHGASLQINHSNTLGEDYLSNTCGACGMFVGTHFLHDYWYEATPVNGYDTGLMCLQCDGRS